MPDTTSLIKDYHHLKNKKRRSAVVKKYTQNISKQKSVLKKERKLEEAENPSLKEERLKNNVPITIESTRHVNETNLPDDDILALEENEDEFAEYFNDTSKEPKILITTSRKPSGKIYGFANEFCDIFPNAHFVKLKNFDVKKIISFCNNREYTDVVVINENNKRPDYLTMIHLPTGPTAFFRLTNAKVSSELHNHGRSTAHTPELILNHFESKLGRQIGRFFAAMFPKLPEFEGRQVATFHNQRDFIFFRRHRYMFDHGQAYLQEIGPRFTLKLRWLKKGVFDASGEMQFEWHPRMQVDRRQFFLS